MGGHYRFVGSGEQEQRVPATLPTLDVRIRFGHDPSASSIVRWTVRQHLSAGEPIDAVILAASELVSNVTRHTDGGGTVHLWRRRRNGPLRLSVYDPDPHLPMLSSHDFAGSCGGLGLSIVAAVADRCGSKRIKSGKLVWAEFRT